MARCLVCPGGQEIPAVELLDHLRLLHPDVYGDGPQRWPDGRLVVYDLAENAEPDTTFTYSELLEALQEGTDREITNSHVYAAVAAANKGLLTDHKRYLGVVRGLGYRVIRADEQLGAALVKKDRAQGYLKRGIELLKHARLDELDAAQRTLHEGQLMIMAGLHQAITESERRHDRADQLIRGLLDSTEEMQKRLDNLEGKP